MVLFLESVIDLIKPVNFSFFGISGWGTDLDYCDVEWFDLETNRDHSVVLRFHPSTAFQSLVDYEGYSISSKEFLPAVVDTVVS